MSAAQKDVGSGYMRVTRAWESSNCLSLASFSTGYVTNKRSIFKSCRSPPERAQVCLLKRHCIHANRFNLILNNTLHTITKYWPSPFEVVFPLHASSKVVLMNMFSPFLYGPAGLQLWCCQRQNNSCEPACSPTSAPSWRPWWSPPAEVSPRSETFSSGSWWRSARTPWTEEAKRNWETWVMFCLICWMIKPRSYVFGGGIPQQVNRKTGEERGL